MKKSEAKSKILSQLDKDKPVNSKIRNGFENEDGMKYLDFFQEKSQQEKLSYCSSIHDIYNPDASQKAVGK